MNRLPCPQCKNVQARCICSFVEPATLPFELIILQHPLESKHAKNTGRLLQLCTQGHIILGEQFDQAQLQNLMSNADNPALLFPSSADCQAQILTGTEPVFDQLWIIDATWKKAKKMMHLNPVLDRLNRIEIVGIDNAWQLRSAPSAQALSTIESVAAVCSIRELSEQHCALNNSFQRWQQHHLKHSPRQYRE